MEEFIKNFINHLEKLKAMIFKPEKIIILHHFTIKIQDFIIQVKKIKKNFQNYHMNEAFN